MRKPLRKIVAFICMGLFAALVWTHRVAVEAHMPEPGGKDGVSARIIGGRPGAEAGASPRSGFGERVASLLRSDPNTILVKLAAVDAVSLLPLPSATGCMQGGLDGSIDLQVDADGLLYVAAPWSTTEMSLRVECPGYQAVRWSGRMPRMPVVDLGLVPLLRVGGVVGSVLQHGRVPMAGVEVVVERRDADAGLAERSWQTCGTRIATTDSAGRFSIPQLEVGPWRVHLQAPFSRSAPADFQVVAGELAEVE
ncbi:MAG: carboxypeptidase regulatory-like domain-containing protein, partial [Phycisphaerales bacterium]|nr:carboxypeptidase regulatory-like domain-containing protein [Phycisphaerales bacterium]